MDPQPVVVVLAAGQGSRFTGTAHKLEQSLGSQSVLGQVLERALGSHLPVIVVTTERIAEQARRHMALRDIVMVPAPGEASAVPLGMGYSIAAGVSARSHAPGWLIMPGDMPLVRSDTFIAVAKALKDHPVAFAQHRGRRGHPVGFSAELFNELSRLSGDTGARRLTARYPACGVEVDDPGVLLDIDTEADLITARVALEHPTRPGAPATSPAAPGVATTEQAG
jgi:molybdenum cofactor cytidylyltransferase